ncbi:hypothetical protein N7478_009375 [Penicillium angulare]|uniref:uncharacterized protein n=1 Tax=Penicillium angulare TaxID=116970 RepID=UPI002541BE9E|nr:uncharacterized protein N7478_009375 [Penicillium angulare]KAJ5266567.1 hypothetical protein N7478_009375 [Penicillium angulare]
MEISVYVSYRERSYIHCGSHQPQCPTPKPDALSAITVHLLAPQTQPATDDETLETKTENTGALDDEMMTAKALAGTVHDAGHLVADQEREGHAKTAIDVTGSAENDQQALQTSAAEDVGIAVIVTATTETKMENDHLEDTAVPVPDPAPRDHPKVPSVPYNGAPPPEKQKPNFQNSGRLAAESNTVQGVSGENIVLKYHEPPEARKPPGKEPWRLYVFKGEELLEMVELSERSCWLIGRERAVVDFPLDHPSCSKQHAALQFRYVEKRNEYGDRIGKVKPYLIDLDSANGSSVNKDPIPGGRYVEVMDKDVMRFGTSTREYVLMLPQ